MIEKINTLVALAPTILLIATSVVGTAALIAAATPTPKDDVVVTLAQKALVALRKVIDFVGANYGGAKNVK